MTASTDRAPLPRQRIRAATVLPAPTTGYRPDIEGLRAVAVLLVVLSHAGVTAVAGGYVGVDVFFVISGFLITSLLLREVESTGRIAIGRFYARRALRLLPAAGLVLVATVLGFRLWLPPVRVGEFAKDALAAVGYFANFRFAWTGTDYLSAGNPPSPFQHFWSLAVEEQFYLAWPLLIIGTVALFRRRRRVLAVVLTLVVGASFVLSITETARSAPWAYFGPHTRVWELGVGALLAVGATRATRIPVRLAAGLGWLGLVAIGAAAATFDDATAYPGWLAAVPVLGAAAVIAAGIGGRPLCGAGALLELRPMPTIGRLSYSWYLWHWPVLMIAPAALGIAGTARNNLLLAAGALGLAWLTYRFVEDPIRHREPLRRRAWHGIGVGAGCSASVVAAALLVGLLPHEVPVGRAAADLRAAVDRSSDPARVLAKYIALARQVTQLPDNLTPAIERVGYDKPRVYDDGCHVESAATAAPPGCVYGDPQAKTTVVLYGDSHAAQWFPALQRIAVRRHWRLVSLTKSACSAADVPIYHETLKRAYTECQSFHRSVLARLKQLSPDLVVVASSFDYRLSDPGADQSAQWQTGWDKTFAQLRATGAQVAAITDTPYPSSRVPSCLSQRPTEINRCNTRARGALRGPDQRAIFRGYARTKAVAVVDPQSWLCSDICPAVLANMVVYRDNSHLSTVFAETLAPLLDGSLPHPR
ncbi:MAG TPA: acyltransferase family protein [Actinoplanes sp.]|nr:acyltransferase family protein [Actinoplanes sp.]